MPYSSSVFTSVASVNRGGGWVKCCSGSSSRSSEGLLGGERGQAGLGVLVRRVVASLEVDPKEPVELQRLSGGSQHVEDLALGAVGRAMSTLTWSNSASAIWQATVRCQISRYSRDWSRSRMRLHLDRGRRPALVGRMAS